MTVTFPSVLSVCTLEGLPTSAPASLASPEMGAPVRVGSTIFCGASMLSWHSWAGLCHVLCLLVLSSRKFHSLSPSGRNFY